MALDSLEPRARATYNKASTLLYYVKVVKRCLVRDGHFFSATSSCHFFIPASRSELQSGISCQANGGGCSVSARGVVVKLLLTNTAFFSKKSLCVVSRLVRLMFAQITTHPENLRFRFLLSLLAVIDFQSWRKLPAPSETDVWSLLPRKSAKSCRKTSKNFPARSPCLEV